MSYNVQIDCIKFVEEDEKISLIFRGFCGFAIALSKRRHLPPSHSNNVH